MSKRGVMVLRLAPIGQPKWDKNQTLKKNLYIYDFIIALCFGHAWFFHIFLKKFSLSSLNMIIIPLWTVQVDTRHSIRQWLMAVFSCLELCKWPSASFPTSYWKLRKLTNEWCLFFYIFIYIFSRAFIIWQNSFTLPKPHGLPLPLGLHVDIASHQIFSSTSSDLLIRLFSSTLFWPILCSFWLLSLFKCCVHYIFQSIAQYHTFCLIFTRFINDCVLIRKLDSESVDL